MEEKTKIQELYEAEKSKKFVNHLIQAYLPVDKPQKVFEFKEGDKKKCSVCGTPLISAEETLQLYHNNQEEMMNYTTEKLKKMVSNDEENMDDHPLKKKLNGRVMAFQGQKTDTFLCAGCIQELLNLVQNGILWGDKNLIWLTKKMQRDSFFGELKKSRKLDDEEKEETEELHKKADKKKKMTFGDLEKLQELKRKMDEEQS